MRKAGIIFPNQLFEQNPLLGLDLDLFLVEEFLFFRQYKFHKQKLIFHRASMKCYAEKSGVKFNYIEAQDLRSDIKELIKFLKSKEYGEIHFIDPVDDWLSKRIKKSGENIKLVQHLNPSFLNTRLENEAFFSDKKRKHQTDFYIWQRKRFGILIDENQKPQAGKWTFDTENRKKYPKGKIPPTIFWPEKQSFYIEAEEYINLHFPENPGDGKMNFILPLNPTDAMSFFQNFLENRYKEFGPYEDAIVARENILHHSLLSPLINAGLILPGETIDLILDFSEKDNIEIATSEGIIRQIIGWREFVRAIYESDGRFQRSKNYWNFTRKIPESFYDGTTGILPVDITIKKVLKTGYCHHIERLMVLGNFMLLCEFDPDEVYRWFMELFLDAYDWVMVPNVYGMSQFADGGLMTTKPYISGSNYLKKMSDYPDGLWNEIWDALFWRFMHAHRDFFIKNPRLNMLLKTYDSWSDGKRNSLLSKAEDYLKSLDKIL